MEILSDEYNEDMNDEKNDSSESISVNEELEENKM